LRNKTIQFTLILVTRDLSRKQIGSYLLKIVMAMSILSALTKASSYLR